MNSPEGRHQPVKTVTMATVARMTGVSQGAISSLLNDRDYGIRVSPATRRKVFETCRQLGYVPNDLRAIVRMYPERGDLAVLSSSQERDFLGDPFDVRLLQGVRSALKGHGSPLTLLELNGAGGDGELPKALLDGIVSRVITVGACPAGVGLALVEREIRHVAVEADPSLALSTVLHADYQQAAHLALEHLHKAGHRNIAVITSDRPGFALRDKLLGAGVKAAARAFRLTIDRTISSQPDWGYVNGSDIAARLAGSPLRVTAAFCYSEEVAAGLIASIQAQGKRLADTLSVISCGDGPLARQIHPGLTTVHIPVEELGRRAVQLLADPEPPASTADTVILPVKLVVRGSVAPAGS